MNRSEISSVLGISEIERDHLIDALWDKLQNEYGVSYPAEWRYKDYPKYKFRNPPIGGFK